MYNRTSITQPPGLIFQIYPKPRVLLNLMLNFFIPALETLYNSILIISTKQITKFVSKSVMYNIIFHPFLNIHFI